MEPNYNYQKETLTWLKPKKEAKIRTGMEFQAIIPECNPQQYMKIKGDTHQISNPKKSNRIIQG